MNGQEEKSTGVWTDMGEKSVQKKKYIVETARQVFVEKGFKQVTMKDIVEACGISRGGLYLYFNNTNEIFLELLRLENRATKTLAADAILEDATAADILTLLLEEQKKEILCRENTLTQAIYEFYFVNSKLSRRDNVLKRQFDYLVRILQKLIEAGVENGEFACQDCEGAARNIVYVLEGLKIAAQTVGVTSQMVDRELQFILHGIGVNKETQRT